VSLISIVQGACGQLNLVRPTVVINSTDLQVLQLLALAKQEGKELARRYDWEILQKEGTFTTTATETQVAVVRTTFEDFGRPVNQSMWNRTQNRPVHGPLTAQQWQKKKAAAAQVGVFYNWRMRGGAILFHPVPTAGDSVYFEYVSNKWCQSSGGTAQVDWEADTDTALVDEELIRLGIVWRFLKAKGLDYAEEFRTYEMALIDLFGIDGGRNVVDMTGEVEGFGVNLEEGTWDLA
jgi:hypothetical protein